MKKTALLLAWSMHFNAPLLAADEPMPTPSNGEPAMVAKGSAEARETICKNGAMVRRVKLDFVEGSSCQVSYLKETEEPGGAEKVLWNAKQEPNYCQDKAQGFIDKLKGMGWTCE